MDSRSLGNWNDYAFSTKHPTSCGNCHTKGSYYGDSRLDSNSLNRKKVTSTTLPTGEIIK